ncbi:MAG: hypothetical protein R2712_00620 [Vicinamibacterales bacterium]
MVRTGADGLDTAALVQAFEDRTLPKASWTHEAHLRVGLWHVRTWGPAGALTRLRAGIRAYNEAVGTPNTDASGYHETLTVFYVRMLAAFMAEPAPDGDAGDGGEGRMLRALGDRRLPLRYYSRERLFSVEARRAWVEPDLVPLPGA